MGILNYSFIFAATAGLFTYILAKLWITTHSFYDICVLLQDNPRYRFVGCLFIAVCGYGIMRLILRFAAGPFSDAEFDRALGALKEIGFDMVLTFVFTEDKGSKLSLTLIPISIRFMVLCLRQRVLSLQLLQERPPLSRHQNLMFVQVSMILLTFHQILSFSKGLKKDTFALAIVIQLMHGLLDCVSDIVRHYVFIVDGINMGNSQEAFRITKLSEFFFSAADLGVNILYLGIMLVRQKMPVHLLRPMYLNCQKLKKEFDAYREWKRVQEFIEKHLPSATEEDLERDDTCIICRLQMDLTEAKRLPCGHCLHSDCLERWIGQQSKCPLCQKDLNEFLKEAEEREKQEHIDQLVRPNIEEEEQVFRFDELDD